MTLHRFFAQGPIPSDGPLPLSAADVHHIKDVLRLSPGDRITIATGGEAAVVRLTEVGDELRAVWESTAPSAAGPRVALAQGIAKGDRMDAVVRQVTELGVVRVIPFVSARCVVRLDPARASTKAERWRRVAAEAAKQSQRNAVPDVLEPVPVERLPEVLGGGPVLVCWEEADAAPGVGEALAKVAPPDASVVTVVVGPEGGLTPEEVGLLQAGGAEVVSLGPTVLRTETAGVVAVALALYERGGLGARRE